MRLIIFQKFNYNYIFFIFYLICCVVEAIIEKNIEEEQAKINEKEKGNFFKVVILITLCLSDFLALIPYYINKLLTKNKNKTITVKDKDKSSISNNDIFIYNNAYEDELRKKSTYLIIYTFIVGFLDCLVQIVYCFYYMDDIFDSTSYYLFLRVNIIFQILSQYILSAIILKTHFYKHHYLSIIINAISFIILLIFDIRDEDDFEFFDSLLGLIFLTFFTLGNAYGKKAMIYGYISPFALIIYKGIYKTILITIFLVIYIPIMTSIEDNFFADINLFDSNKTILTLMNLIFNFLKDLFNWILIDRFSPSHLALSLIIENLSYFITYIIDYGGDNKGDYPIWEIVMRIVIHFILFIAALIHNEIFIITKWGLGENTKLFFDEKAKEEMLLSDPDTDENFLKQYDSMIELDQNTFNNEEINDNLDYINNND